MGQQGLGARARARARVCSWMLSMLLLQQGLGVRARARG